MPSRRTLFELTEEDAQVMALVLLGRTLDRNEIDTVRQLVQWGLDGWQGVLEDAILKAERVRDPWFWAKHELVQRR